MLDAQALEQLLASSRPGSGDEQWQQRLPQVASSTRHLLQLIAQSAADEEGVQAARQQDLLLCFRVVRNTCAHGPAAAAQVLALGMLDLMRATLDLVSTATISLDWQLPAAVSQALANLCNACAAGAAAAWATLFPLHFNMLAHINAGSTQAATSLALLACCKSVAGAPAALAGPQGGEMMTALLCSHKRQLTQGGHNDNLCLLLVYLAFHLDLLPALFDSLGPPEAAASSCSGDGSGGGSIVAAAGSSVAGSGGGSNTAAGQPTLAQAVLLEILGEEAQDMPQLATGPGADDPGMQPRSGASMAFLVQLVQQVAATSKLQPGGLSPGQQQVLQDALHLMRDVCARDDSGRGLADGACLVSELQAAGFLPALLAMLKALEPIQNPQRQQAAAAEKEATGGSGGIQVAELAPELSQQAQQFPAMPPYPGFRTDLLAAVSNAAHKRPTVQAEVQRLGGVELVLAQCQLDRASPLAREWALWGVRNLCEGNPQAQEAIRQLQLCTTVDSEELQRLGVKLELDERSGKLRVTKREAPAAPTP